MHRSTRVLRQTRHEKRPANGRGKTWSWLTKPYRSAATIGLWPSDREPPQISLITALQMFASNAAGGHKPAANIVPSAIHPFVRMMTPEAGPVRHDPMPSGTAAPPPEPSVASSGRRDPRQREAHRVSDGPSISRGGDRVARGEARKSQRR